MKTLNYVDEFHSIIELKRFLDQNNETEKFIILKVYRSSDGVYFVWYKDLEIYKGTEE